MAFTGNAMCTSFKVELLKGVHNFWTGGNSFKEGDVSLESRVAMALCNVEMK